LPTPNFEVDDICSLVTQFLRFAYNT